MEKAHGAVFCLRFSRIGYPGAGVSLLLFDIGFPGLRVSSLFEFLSFSCSSTLFHFLDTYGGVRVSKNRTLRLCRRL
jgi:hypothetical protein